MSSTLGLLLLSLICGYRANVFPVDHDPSSLLVDPAAPPIVGGDVAPPGSAPHMVALFQIQVYVCGGSLISSRTVLTAAHCLGGSASLYMGKVGTNLLDTGGSEIYFEKAVAHPDFLNTRFNKKNDIGIMVTTEPVQFSELVKPITLSYQHVGGGVEVKAAGWGSTQGSGTGPSSNELLQLVMTSVDTPECQRSIAEISKLTVVDGASMVCALHSLDHGVCRGDSGSALVRTDTGEQVGLVSHGFPCARGVPDVFSRVSPFKDFIEANKV